MWGIIPAAGQGTRIQPLAFSKELLPVGHRRTGELERPRAVSEYLVERMLAAGVDRICMVIAPDKTDILGYYGAQVGEASICYVVQPSPGGLCDALFRALPLIGAESGGGRGLPGRWLRERRTVLSNDEKNNLETGAGQGFMGLFRSVGRAGP